MAAGLVPETEPATTARWTWKIGSLFGIAVHIHATFVLLLAWVAFSHLAQGHGVRGAADGLALVLAVFGVVVLHELGHALTARRFGIRTRDITLLPIGGVATLERMPDKPGQELLVALAGPAVNLALALALGALAMLTVGTLALEGVTVVGGPFLIKLVWINVSLAVFNLLPAFPMDGGRVLRAALALRMSYPRATEVAAHVGQAMALLLGALGLTANPMLLLIALFVWMGATQELTTTKAKSALSGIPIRSAMVREFRTVAPHDPLSRAAELMLAGFQHDFPVLDDGQVVGILTRDELVRGLAEGGASLPIRQVMKTAFAIGAPGELIEHALGRLHQSGTSALVVFEAGQLVGLLTLENIGELMVLQSALRSHRTQHLAA